MQLSENEISKLFGNLASGKSEEFFKHVADDVQWQVMGTHPLAGTYHSKEDFLNHTFRRLNKILKDGVILKVKNVYVSDDTAIVEMESLSTAKNGNPFYNTYCWVTRFSDDKIVEVRAYVDSFLVKQVIAENEEEARGQVGGQVST